MNPSNEVTDRAAPCPWCGESPDVTNDAIFQLADGVKWGALTCCGAGPEVRTDYKDVSHWKSSAIAAWNERTPAVPAIPRTSAEAVPVGWLIEWTSPGGIKGYQFHKHNTLADYRYIYRDVTATELVRRATPAPADSAAERDADEVDPIEQARRDGWAEGMQEATELLAEEIKLSARYVYLIEQIPCSIADDLQCGIGEIGDEIDAAIAALHTTTGEGT